MDLSIIADEQMLAMDDSFLLTKPEAMDDEVSQILKKWNLTNPSPKKIVANETIANQNETFDTRTFTRPKRRIFPASNQPDSESMESGIASINLQVGGQMSSFSPKFMQKSWLNDVSPPSSICTSMDFQNVDNMLNSLITSGDFTDVSFLLNGNDANNAHVKDINATVTLDNVSPTKNLTRNLMDFTFDVTKTDRIRSSETFVNDSEPPMKEFGINNADITLCESTEDFESKNLTYNACNNGNLTWDKIQEHQNMMNATIIQSTPVHTHIDAGGLKKTFDYAMSPISRSQLAGESDEDEEVIIRSLKSRRLVNDVTIDDYRNSMEDQCEFLLNEETIKLSSRVCGDSFETLDEKSEKDFDKLLDSFNVKKSLEGEKLLQSVDTIKQRHSLINLEKQREEKLKKDDDSDNKTQYETMSKSNERLLRRSRLYDDVNLQLQKQQIETHEANSQDANTVEDQGDVVEKSNRDRFKTIKLNKKLQSGMVIVNDEAAVPNDVNSTSPGANKERQNKLNQKTQECEDVEFKRPAPAPSRMSKFGFSRPTYRSRQDLNLPLKASSTDSLDNDVPRTSAPTVKSPMGIKSKSIHNLMFNGNSGSQPSSRIGSYGNLKLSAANSQSSLKGSRASSLVRQVDQGFKPPTSSFYNPLPSQVRAPSSRKTSLVRPSSGYYGAYSAKQLNSDNESGCSLSSSSASSRNSVAADQQQAHDDNNSRKAVVTGTIPKASGLRLPSNLRAPQARSGLPRPTTVKR